VKEATEHIHLTLRRFPHSLTIKMLMSDFFGQIGREKDALHILEEKPNPNYNTYKHEEELIFLSDAENEDYQNQSRLYCLKPKPLPMKHSEKPQSAKKRKAPPEAERRLEPQQTSFFEQIEAEKA